jgi:uncharacterized protein YegJ (DUF2314 family)
LRRLGWHPLLALGPFSYLAYRTYLGGAGVATLAALAFVGIWLGLSIYDWFTAHRWLDWLYRNEESPARLISFVALLREPVTFDPAVIAKLAGRAWNADLGDGASEGADGWVADAGPTTLIMHEGRRFLIHSIPAPYTEDPEKEAEGIFGRPYTDNPEKEAEVIPEMRIRALFLKHRAWFSCDALDVDAATSEEEVLDCYERLGKLFAELLDDKCLVIYVQDSGLWFLINENTQVALRSKDPVGALQRTSTVPIIEVSPDDPLMKQAVEKARQKWPTFVAAFEANAGQKFAVKAPITQAGNTEFIWIMVTSLEGDFVYGELGNDPGNLGRLKLGSKVSVRVTDVNDWGYIDSHGNLTGVFTREAMARAACRSRSE